MNIGDIVKLKHITDFEGIILGLSEWIHDEYGENEIKTWKVFRAANRSPAERSFHPFPGGGPGVFCPGRMRPVGTLDPSTTRFSLQLLFSAALSLSLEDRYICSDPPFRPLRHPKITQPGQSLTGLSLLTPAPG